MKLFVAALILSFITQAVSAQDKPEGLFINSKAPDFKAKDQNGVDFRLKDALKNGAVVLVFYRGNWCPYCSKHLKRLEDSLSLIKEKGAQLIAVTPEKGEGIAKTVEKTGASYTIIYDEGMKIMKAYDVDFIVDDRTVSRYKSSDIDLLELNGQKEKVTLPIPAIYIINKEGTVDYRYFDSDYRKRPWVREILENLK